MAVATRSTGFKDSVPSVGSALALDVMGNAAGVKK